MPISTPSLTAHCLLFISLCILLPILAQSQQPRKPLPIRVVHLESGAVSTMPFGPKQQLLTLRTKEEKVRQFGGAIRYSTKSTLQLPSQKALSLADDERFYGQASQNTFWTRRVVQTDSGSYTALRTYSIHNNKLIVQKETRLSGFEYSLESIDGTGNWVYSDCNEGDCGEVTLLNSDLKEIKKYAPWPEGFQEIGTFINEGRVGVLLHPHSADKPFRLAMLNAQTGDILFERDLPRHGHSASGLYVNSRYGLLVTWPTDMSEAETLCFDAQTGATIWTKPGNLLNNYTVTDTQQLLVHDYEDLSSYELATGTLRWKTHIMDFHKTTRPDFNGIPVKVVSGADGRAYLLVKDFPTVDAPTISQEQAKLTQHTTLYELTERGRLVRQQRLGQLGLEMRLNTVTGGLVVRDKQLVPAKRVTISQNAQARMAAPLNPNQTWPVPLPTGITQGRVTGTPGEFRTNSSRTNWRFHLGIDVGKNTISDDITVLAVAPGKLSYFISGVSPSPLNETRSYQIEPFGSYLKVGSLYYYHTAPGIIDIVNGKTKISKLWSPGDDVSRGDTLGEMYTEGIDEHVHMQDADVPNGVIQNYLSNGYNVSGWTHIDGSTPTVRNDGITFHKGKKTDNSIPSDKEIPTGNHSLFVENDRFISKQIVLAQVGPNPQVPVLFGKVDIISNAYDQKTGYSGENENAGNLAPYKLGYELTNLRDQQKVSTTVTGKPTWPTIQFNQIKKDPNSTSRTNAIAAKIHANGSTLSSAKWIVTNRYENGDFEEDAWDTQKVLDGLYEVKIIAEDAPSVVYGPSIPNRGEGKKTVYVDNNGAYIEKVTVSGDANNSGQYSGYWTSDPTNPGQISFQLVNSTSFKPKATYQVKVQVSEPVKNLSLKLIQNGSSVGTVGSPNTSDNITFTFDITTPDNPASPAAPQPVVLEFEGTSAVGEKLVALTKNNTSINVNKRVANPGFTEGKDQRHELTFCNAAQSNLTLNINNQNNATVLLSASGGTQPYTYAKNSEAFASITLFNGLQPNTTYTFRVQDNNGCQAERTYSYGNNSNCNIRNTGGQSASIQPFRHDLGTNAGNVTISYDMYSIPDRMDVRYNGSVARSTGGLVSGAGTLSFDYNPSNTSNAFCIVEMIAPNSGTAWEYTINCPVVRTGGLRIATTEEIQPQLTYQPGETSAAVQVGPPVGTSLDKSGKTETYYTVRFRYLGDSLWTELRDQLLPITIGALEKDREVEIKIQEQDGVNPPGAFPVKVVPNPNDGQFTLEFTNLAPEPGQATLEVVDIRGTVLLQRSWDVVPGINKLPLQLGPPTTGTVVVRLKLNEKIWVTSFLLLR